MLLPFRVSAGLATAISCCLSAASTASQPNVLFLMTEDQGAQVSHQAFERHATAGLETPHMDALIDRGVAFTQAFVTTPVCSASKAAVYTGLYGHTNGIRQNTINFFKPADQLTAAQRNSPFYRNATISASMPTLVTRFEEAGYHLGISGKLHVGKNEAFPYDDWIAHASGEAVGRMIDNAEAAGKPWFIWYNVHDPHRLYGAADRVSPDEVEPPSFLPNTAVSREEWACYLSDVERADDKIGEALAEVDKAGHTDQTLVVFMGDHGVAFHRGKMSPYDFSFRTVLTICGPGIPSGELSDALVSGVDLMPTLMDLAGLSRPPRLHGKSLVPLLRANPSISDDDFRD